jgi:phosphonatase-like hydrolase
VAPALELVVFDLAGTTVKDDGQVPGAFVTALAERGIQVTSEQLKNVRGASKRQAVFDLIPAGAGRAVEAEAAYASFKRHLARAYDAHLEPIDGAARMFTELRSRGVRIALTTGFDRDVTGALLAALGWDRHVADAVVSGDEVARGRPAPYLIFHAMEATGTVEVRRVAAVGDTTLDLTAGYNAGVRWNVGVLSGAHDRASLQSAQHTHLIPSVAELSTVLPLG